MNVSMQSRAHVRRILLRQLSKLPGDYLFLQIDCLSIIIMLQNNIVLLY